MWEQAQCDKIVQRLHSTARDEYMYMHDDEVVAMREFQALYRKYGHNAV
jgi:hypothetical protein